MDTTHSENASIKLCVQRTKALKNLPGILGRRRAVAQGAFGQVQKRAKPGFLASAEKAPCP
jgi:hypothetical protein